MDLVSRNVGHEPRHDTVCKPKQAVGHSISSVSAAWLRGPAETLGIVRQ